MARLYLFFGGEADSDSTMEENIWLVDEFEHIRLPSRGERNAIGQHVDLGAFVRIWVNATEKNSFQVKLSRVETY